MVKKIVFLFGIIVCNLVTLLFCSTTYAKNENDFLNLYARAAVLIDADSGRILYGKNENLQLPMASTTKIMTLIVALEADVSNQIVEVGYIAERQPRVKLGMKKGQKYLLQDLYYSMMLESHNDTAVCIASHVGKHLFYKNNIQDDTNDMSKETEEQYINLFIKQMNKKAEQIGLKNTCFITPNGLDAEYSENNKKYKHSTTALDLAKLLRYCIKDSDKKAEFLKITGTMEYSISELDGRLNCTCKNHNKLLEFISGAYTGKTGFTGEAGYCYVGAVKENEKDFIIALLACGWPGNKHYKWIDSKKLYEYGSNEFYSYEIKPESYALPDIIVKNKIKIPIILENSANRNILIHNDSKVKAYFIGNTHIDAPVRYRQILGKLCIYSDEELIGQYHILADEEITEKTVWLYLKKVLENYFLHDIINE